MRARERYIGKPSAASCSRAVSQRPRDGTQIRPPLCRNVGSFPAAVQEIRLWGLSPIENMQFGSSSGSVPNLSFHNLVYALRCFLSLAESSDTGSWALPPLFRTRLLVGADMELTLWDISRSISCGVAMITSLGSVRRTPRHELLIRRRTSLYMWGMS